MTDKERKSVPLTFRLEQDTYEKMMELKEEMMKDSKLAEGLRIVKSDFYRMVFKEGLKALQRKLNNPNYCDNCGKRLPITVPKHMRKRLEICECD